MTGFTIEAFGCTNQTQKSEQRLQFYQPNVLPIQRIKYGKKIKGEDQNHIIAKAQNFAFYDFCVL